MALAMDIVHVRAAGIDIGKTEAVVCVRVQGEGGALTVETVTTWATTTDRILDLADMLLGEQVTCVTMEATGDYWKPFFYLFQEAGLDGVLLANPKQVRQIPGRKTDVQDAQWLAALGAFGLVRGSFVPAWPVRELKDLVRLRTVYTRQRGEEIQRLEKTLESACVKLSTRVTDLMGVSGRRMLDALVSGKSRPDEIAELAHPCLRASKVELVAALTGRVTDHHRFLLATHLGVIDRYQADIDRLDHHIDSYFTDDDNDAAPTADVVFRADMRLKRELLDTIPGVGKIAAEQILAELGPDLSAFPTARHLVSWGGVCPGSNASAGKVKSAKTRDGNTYLKGTLGVVALAAAKKKDTFLAARYKRVTSRQGKKRALVAIEHSILTSIWHILTETVPYQELGADYYDKRKPGQTIRNAINRLRQAGLTVTYLDHNQLAITPT
jgi:transposase